MSEKGGAVPTEELRRLLSSVLSFGKRWELWEDMDDSVSVVEEGSVVHKGGSTQANWVALIDRNGYGISEEDAWSIGRFIVAMRNALPALLDTADRERDQQAVLIKIADLDPGGRSVRTHEDGDGYFIPCDECLEAKALAASLVGTLTERLDAEVKGAGMPIEGQE